MWSAGAKALIDQIRLFQYPQPNGYGAIWWDEIMHRIMQLSVADARLPLILADDSVWPEQRRRVHYTQPYYGLSSSCNYMTFAREVWTLAERENAPRVTEWHIVKVICDGNLPNLDGQRKVLLAIGINPDKLLELTAEASGRVELSSADREKTWCFCDTSVFLQYQFFDQVDWHVKLKLPSVVLVVPPVVTGELDHSKAHPDPRRERQRDRAKKVIRRFSQFIPTAVPGSPVRLRTGVELLLQGHEPTVVADGLDPHVPDDRLIAAAIEFRWSRVGSKVAILSSDLNLRVKAWERRIDVPELPEELEQPTTDTSPQPPMPPNMTST